MRTGYYRKPRIQGAPDFINSLLNFFMNMAAIVCRKGNPVFKPETAETFRFRMSALQKRKIQQTAPTTQDGGGQTPSSCQHIGP